MHPCRAPHCRQALHRAMLLAALSLGAMPSASHAASLNVAPVRLVLTPERAIASVVVGNAGEGEVAIHAEVFAWSQEAGRDIYQPTREVIVNPAIFRVAAQGRQIVRLGLQVQAGSSERSYRVFFQQLPRPQASVPNAPPQVATLLRIGVPIFVPPLQPRQALQWRLVPTSDGSHALALDNAGSEHVQLTRLTVTGPGGATAFSRALSTYVLAGQSAVVTPSLPGLQPGAMVRVEAQSDAASTLPAVELRTPALAAKSR